MAMSTGGVICSPCPLNFKDVPEHITSPIPHPTKCHACKNDSRRPAFTSHSISLLASSFFFFSSWRSSKRHHWICEKHDAVKRRVTESATDRERVRETVPWGTSSSRSNRPPSPERCLSLSLCLHAYGRHDMLWLEKELKIKARRGCERHTNSCVLVFVRVINIWTSLNVLFCYKNFTWLCFRSALIKNEDSRESMLNVKNRMRIKSFLFSVS